jgi:hypothetical protein
MPGSTLKISATGHAAVAAAQPARMSATRTHVFAPRGEPGRSTSAAAAHPTIPK